MPNENEREYKTLVTAIGKSKIAAVIQGSEKVNITQIAVGDGNGAFYVPTADMTALLHEVWRGNIAGKWINEHSANMVDVKVVLPADVGGFTVREAALFDEENNMIAICNIPDTEKAVITTGAAGTLTLVMHIVLTDVDAVEFTIDPHLDVMTSTDVDLVLKKHDADLNAHPTLKGGTVTYEVPKEHYIADFFAFDRNNTTDPDEIGIKVFLPCALFPLAKITIDAARYEADVNSGVIEDLSDDILDLPLDEQIPIIEECYKNYMTISKMPWCPNTIKPLLYYFFANNQTISPHQVFRNDIKIQIIIKRENTEEQTSVVASTSFFGTGEIANTNAFYPFILTETESDDNLETTSLAIMILGDFPKYFSDKRYATEGDTIEEVTFTFIPNNTYVEADENDESV